MIDWSQVKQLEFDVGAEDFAEVVTLFLMEVDEAIEALALESPSDPDALAAALHFLKGSAFNLGFQTFGERCGVGETACNGGQATDVSVPEIIALYHQSKDAFLKEASVHCSYVV